MTGQPDVAGRLVETVQASNGTVPNLGYLVCLVILAALRGVVAVVMREGEV